MLTASHYAVLESLKAGQSLTTRRAHSRTTAQIGPKRIPIAIVADLEDANMIRCRQVEGEGAPHDHTRHFEFVSDASDARSTVARSVKKREPRIRRDDARQQIIAAWRDWWVVRKRMGKVATDADAHLFLRELRSDQPLLFTFPGGRQKPYEVAFSWLIAAGILAA